MVIAMRAWMTLVSVGLALGAAAIPSSLPSASRAQPRAEAAEAPGIVVVMRGLRSDRGVASAGVYDSAATWTHGGQEVATCNAPVVGGVSRCRLEGVRPGHYAVAVMHDEDADGEFDTGFLGIPTEGYGFSRDARGTLGAPSFDSAAFEYEGGVHGILVTMRYGI
jgi:uncharacterized protein (DUF2141 family)